MQAGSTGGRLSTVEESRFTGIQDPDLPLEYVVLSRIDYMYSRLHLVLECQQAWPGCRGDSLGPDRGGRGELFTHSLTDDSREINIPKNQPGLSPLQLSSSSLFNY